MARVMAEMTEGGHIACLTPHALLFTSIIEQAVPLRRRPKMDCPEQASDLYKTLHSLAITYLTSGTKTLLALRSDDATHSWGHNYLVTKNPSLAPITTALGFEAHLQSSGRYFSDGTTQISDIIIDEYRFKASVRMSYFLTIKDKTGGAGEEVENDLIWLLTFIKTDGEGSELHYDGWRVKNGIEFIDAAASGRMGQLAREANGGVLAEDVRGGLGVRLSAA
jgi:hypothetical protein